MSYIPLISNQKQGNMQNAPYQPCDTLSNTISNYTGPDKYGNCYTKCLQTCPNSNCAGECDKLIFSNMVTYPPPTTPALSGVAPAIQNCINNSDISSNTCEDQIINCCLQKSDIVNYPSSGLPGTKNYVPSGMESCYTAA